MTLFALILAGGQGSRLGGVRKASLRIGGIPLLSRVASRLPGASRPLLVADAGRGTALLPDMISLADPPAVAGPLAGLRAAVSHLAAATDADMLITVAVDTPFLPADLAERLVTPLRTGTAASHAVYGAAPYPTNAAYRVGPLRETLPSLPAEAGPRSLLAALAAVPVDWADSAGDDPFASLNTLDDLVALGRRARAEPS